MAEALDSYIEDVSMSSADNGVIISYCERKKMSGKGTYDAGYDYNRRQEVFDFDEDEEEGEEFKKAFDRYKELFTQSIKDKKKRK